MSTINSINLMAIVCSVLWLAACSSGSDDPVSVPPINAPAPADDDPMADAPATNDPSGPPVMPPLLSVELSRDVNGSIFIDTIERVPSVVGAHRPWSAIEGDLAAVAYQGDQVVDAALVSFTSEFSTMHGDDEEDQSGSRQPVAATQIDLSSVVVHIDASEMVDRVDIVDTALNVLASTSNIPAQAEPNSRIRTGIFPNQPWIRLLEPSYQLPDGISSENLKAATFEDIEVLRRALDTMPIRLQQSVHTVGFLTRPDKLEPGYTTGGTVFLRPSTPYKMTGTFVHEAGHAYAKLSQKLSGSLDIDTGSFQGYDAWPVSIRTTLQTAHDEMGFGLFENVVTYWAELHARAEKQGLAKPYGTALLNLDAYRNGFVTSRARDKLEEDFADTIRVANIQTMSTAGNGSDTAGDYKADACRAYNNLTKLEKETALAYVKLQLVRVLGLAEPDSVDWCVGDVAPTTTPGVDFPTGISSRPETPARDYTFNQSMSAGYTDEDREEFIIVAQDSANRGIGIELNTDGGRPEGAFVLDGSWWGNFYPDNDLYIAPLAAGIEGQARTTERGIVVITYASSGDRVDGFVFDLVLLDALGGTYQYDFVPFRIPL